MTRRIVLVYDEPGAAPSVVTDSVGKVEVYHLCPWAVGDELYQSGERSVERDTARVDSILAKYRAGHFGDRPGVENQVADMLGVDRPHDLPGKPTLAVDNEGDA
jgi:hypothetical protein